MDASGELREGLEFLEAVLPAILSDADEDVFLDTSRRDLAAARDRFTRATQAAPAVPEARDVEQLLRVAVLCMETEGTLSKANWPDGLLRAREQCRDALAMLDVRLAPLRERLLGG